jgi:hypothetical protein
MAAAALGLSAILSLTLAAPAQAASASSSRTYYWGAYRCTNTIKLYTLGGSVQDTVAIAQVSCNHSVRRLTIDVWLKRNDNLYTNRNLCSDATGCATSKRINNPSGTQTFGACVVSGINGYEVPWDSQQACVTFRA